MATSSLNAPVITDEYARQELESLTEEERRRLHEDLYGESTSSSTADTSSTCSHDQHDDEGQKTAATSEPPTAVPVKTSLLVAEDEDETPGPRKALTRNTPSTRTMTSSSSISSVSDEEEEAEEGDHSGSSDDVAVAAASSSIPPATTSTVPSVAEEEVGTDTSRHASSAEQDDDDETEEETEGDGGAADDDGGNTTGTGAGSKYFQFNLPSTLVTGVTETFSSEEALSLAVQAMIDGGTGISDVNNNTECTVFSDRDKRDYLEAKKICPQVVQKESDPIYFLRCEDYNIKAAAKRLVDYWKLRVKVFGKEMAFISFEEMEEKCKYYQLNKCLKEEEEENEEEEMKSQDEEEKEEKGATTNQSGIENDDCAFLSSMDRTDYLIRLPQDQHGRAVFYYEPRLMYHEPDRSNRTIRGVFYLLAKTACENEQWQRKGFVALHNQTNELPEFFCRRTTRMIKEILNCMPMKMKVTHAIQKPVHAPSPSSNEKDISNGGSPQSNASAATSLYSSRSFQALILPIFRFLLGREYRLRFVVHDTVAQQDSYKILEGYGLNRSDLPTILGGYYHHRQPSGTTTPSTKSPSPNKVIHQAHFIKNIASMSKLAEATGSRRGSISSTQSFSATTDATKALRRYSASGSQSNSASSLPSLPSRNTTAAVNQPLPYIPSSFLSPSSSSMRSLKPSLRLPLYRSTSGGQRLRPTQPTSQM